MEKLFVIGAITQQMHDQLSPSFSLHFASDMADPISWLTEHGAAISYVLTNGHDGVPADMMALMPQLKLISNYGVGYDAIDVVAARANHIIVTHTPSVLSEEVATTALMLMLACYRELSFNEAHLRQSRWVSEGNAPLSRSADNRVVGIVGLGRIGEAIARKLIPFNAEILYHNRRKKDVPYEYVDDLVAMAARSDVLIIATPGGAETSKLVSKEVIEAIGPEGMLVNIARGSVVDEGALITALSSGALGSAGLDVFENEPHVPEALRDMMQVVLTPHIASATHETRQAMGQLTVDNIICYHNSNQVHSPVPECADIAQTAPHPALD